MPVRDMTSRIAPGMTLVRTQQQRPVQNDDVQRTGAEDPELQQQYNRYEGRAQAAEAAVDEYNAEAEELQRLADQYAAEEDSAKRQQLSEEIRDRIGTVNAAGERLSAESAAYNDAYDAAVAAGAISGGGRYETDVPKVTDPFVTTGGASLVETGGAGPEAAYLTPLGDANAAREKAVQMTANRQPLVTPVEQIDMAVRSVLPDIKPSEQEMRFAVVEGVDPNPLRRAYTEFRTNPTEYAATAAISAATGGVLGAGMKVLPKVGAAVVSKVPAAERLGVLARPVADKQIRKAESAVAARVSPAAGETVGNVARGITTPAMLPLNVAGGVYAVDVGQRVTAPTEDGAAPSTAEMGSRLGTIVATEIIPMAVGGRVAGGVVDRWLDGPKSTTLGQGTRHPGRASSETTYSVIVPERPLLEAGPRTNNVVFGELRTAFERAPRAEVVAPETTYSVVMNEKARDLAGGVAMAVGTQRRVVERSATSPILGGSGNGNVMIMAEPKAQAAPIQPELQRLVGGEVTKNSEYRIVYDPYPRKPEIFKTDVVNPVSRRPIDTVSRITLPITYEKPNQMGDVFAIPQMVPVIETYHRPSTTPVQQFGPKEAVATTSLVAETPLFRVQNRQKSSLDEILIGTGKGGKLASIFPTSRDTPPGSPFENRNSRKSKFTERFRLW